MSSVWETAPIGDIPQGDYLNAVVLLDTVVGPRPLLDDFLRIESDAGRERRERWGPRPLDLDLLLYGDAEIDTPDLQVPHPRMSRRRFVLQPLAEVWPEAMVPGHGAVSDLLARVQDQVVRLEATEWLSG